MKSKENILGFNQEMLIKNNLDIKDVMLLRYFVDFINSDKMKFEIKDGKKYYLVVASAFAEALPILGIGKQAVLKRLHKLTECNILNNYTVRVGGTFAYFSLGAEYEKLLPKPKNEVKKEDEKSTEKGIYENKTPISSGIDPIYQNIDPSIPEDRPLYTTVSNKDKSLRYKSLRYKSSKREDIDIILKYLCKKMGRLFHLSENIESLIYSKLENGHTVNDFKTVIDKKCNEWLGTRMQTNLTPSCLFGNKFEEYLMQLPEVKAAKTNKPIERKNRFNNFESREYDYDDLEKKLLGWD